MSQTELEKETLYLQQVYQKLVQAETEFTEILENAKDDGLATLESMKGDVGLNFDNYSENLDTFAAIEMKNREIDQMNLKVRTADITLQKVKRLLKSPYFGKVSVDFLEADPLEDFYIGIHNFTDEVGNILIYDWRSPITELFYNNVIGPSFYRVNQNKIDVEIAGRRQFVIERDRLLKFFDTAVAIQDDVLLNALKQDSTRQMKDITTTIQKEQNTIIRDTQHPILLVDGVAGSGKTSTIMQRIAYLLYSLRQEITSDNILILSPNNQFISYISDVLPSLGEQNPQNMTLLQFAEYYLGKPLEDEATYFTRISRDQVDSQTTVLRSKEFSHYIQQSGTQLQDAKLVFNDVTRKGKVIISKEEIAKIYTSTPEFSGIIDKIQATKKRLISYWEQRIRTQAKNNDTQNQILSLSEDLQQKYFGEFITDESEESIFSYGKRLLRKQYRLVTKQIQQNKWIDVVALFESLYVGFKGEDYIFANEEELNLDEAVLLLLIRQTFIEKIDIPNRRFILIDEVQDYTSAQMYLLADLFPRSHFTMVGDENQAIFNSSSTFDEILINLTSRKNQIKHYNLLNSYRSSGAITKVFRQLATSNEKMEIVPIRPDGKEPQFFESSTIETFCALLEQISVQLQGEKLTIITKTEEEATWLITEIDSQLLEKLNVHVIPISLSKGLEFDHVLVYNASSENYTSQRDQRILYTAVSRGMKRLFVSYEGAVSKLFGSRGD
ncbi:RNA polymerase recycling motor HelD [Carnobacterium gallinarum]|uniref:RNA polymerase recycling motor HelD n=1 Tax=Carnobacterium gallinarum TaxID=2749 RepID=UPI000553455F|nr:RNA polymerase recycling motor HelD [Carnobacterium gallinarum]